MRRPLEALRTRAATAEDAVAISEIYNQGIADRVATFETEPRTSAQIAEWFEAGHLVMMAKADEIGPVAFAAAFPYSGRPCYAGIAEFSIYVARARSRPSGALRPHRRGPRQGFAQAREPGISGKHSKPGALE